MSNWSKDAVLDFLNRHAPEAPLSRCLSLANDVERLKGELLYVKEMMAILSQLLLDDKGSPLPQYKDVRPAVKQALESVSACHGWVVCGPVSDAMEKLMSRVEEEEKARNHQ